MANKDLFDVGRAHRNTVPLEAHADLDVGEDRPSPVDLLAAQDTTRLQELVPIRHGRMRVTPFTFYRGTAAIMASDLSRTASTDLRVQLCGDAHLSNFGVFRGPDRRLVFDVNDFDETAPGPLEWDLKRLAASVTIAGRNNELSEKEIRRATRASVRWYREVLNETAHMSPLDVHYYRIEVDSLMARAGKNRREKLSKSVNKALRKDSVRALNKLTTVVDGKRRIVPAPPVVTRVDDLISGVVRGQRLMQATGDILLGWSRYHHDDRAVDFYFRQLWDGKGSAEVDDMGPNRLKNYAWHCGGALALAHARSRMAATISGYLGEDRTIDDVLVTFAEQYADLNDVDYLAHEQAIEDGRITVRDAV